MNRENLPVLRIGSLEICPPIIQGGMGIRVSGASLASAVAETGCVGVIASAGLGDFENHFGEDARRVSEEAFRLEIRKARALSDGILGVNIMVALSDYDNLVKAAVDENVDVIISGAGLPLSLPQFVGDKDIKLVPIVSSGRTFQIICKRWAHHFNRLPDAVIVEGVKAGGHLGYSHESIADGSVATLEQILADVITIANTHSPRIPVIAAGGIFTGNDIAKVLKLGASGVQMATRFVCTDECDVHINFKQAYLNSHEKDLTIIHSPVGLPGRVINSPFVEGVKQGKTHPIRCNYQCLRTCDPKTAPYCIAKVLSDAAEGHMETSFAFAGSNAYRCTEIVSVRRLVDQLADELAASLAQAPSHSQV
jgi:nitronate monooxygenase